MKDGPKDSSAETSLEGLVKRHFARSTDSTLARQETVAAATTQPNPQQSFKAAQTVDRMTILPVIQDADSQISLREDRAEKLRYKPKRGLGVGAMGIVELARDQDIGRHVAIKKLKCSSDPKAIARMVEEVRIVGQLEHPNIVPIHDVGLTSKGDYYFVMRFVDGLTLGDIIHGLKRGDATLHARFPFRERIRVFREILNAVAFAHDHGVIHRDLKPENIMVGHNGEVFVMDWGIAYTTHEGKFALDFQKKLQRAAARNSHIELQRPTATKRPQEDQIQGTPLYMAPQQVQGINLKGNDVYTLGVILHEFLCLHHYLDEKQDLTSTLQGVMEDPLPPAFQYRSTVQKRVPIEWSHFITATVQKDAHERFPQARDMLIAFNLVDDGRFKILCPSSLTIRSLTALVQFVDAYPTLAYICLIAGTFGIFFRIGRFLFS